MKISTGNLLHAYGPRPGDDMHYPYSVRLVVRMADPVDGGCLRRAMEPTARRYPYYCQKLRRQGEEIVLEPNDAPVPVTEGDAPLCLGSPEANGHLFAAAFSGDRLYFDMWHGYADGAGMYNVLRTLLYYYCRERYEPELEPGPIRVLGEEIDPAEAVDPMDALPDVDLSKLPKVERPRSFSPYDADALTPCHRKVYDIQIPEAPLLRFTSANDASPGTLVNLFLARAIDGLHPHRDDPIVGGYVMNARPMLGAPKSPANCVSSMQLEYKDRMKGIDLTTQATIYRGMTFLQSDEERVRRTLLMAAARYRMAAAIPTLAGRQEAFSQFMTMGAGVYTFTVSYVGKGNYGGAEKYIREFWTHVPTAMPILIEVAAIHGNIFLSLHQRFEEDLYVRAFLRQFEENGIPAKLVHVSAGELPGVVDLGTL